MGVRETVDVAFNDTYSKATVKGSKSEKAARAKVHKLLKEQPVYKNGWTLWFLFETENGDFNYSLTNSYRSVVEQLEAAIESTKQSAAREIS